MSFIGDVMGQSLAVVDALHTVNKTAGTVNGAAVDMMFFHRILYILDVGVVGSSGTIDFKLQAAAASSFATPVDITGKAITQIVASTAIVKVGATAEDATITVANGRYIRGVTVVAVATSQVCLIALGGCARWKPANSSLLGKEIAAVTQTILDAS